MKAKIFRQAAQELVESSEKERYLGACAALNQLVSRECGEDATINSPYLMVLSYLFCPDMENEITFWWGLPWREHQILERSLALLLCAEVIKDGEEP